LKLKDADTLFLRIFLLMLVAFTISSVLGVEIFRHTAQPPRPWDDAGRPRFADAAGPGFGAHPGDRPGSGPFAASAPRPGFPGSHPGRAFAGPPGPPWFSIGIDAALKIVIVTLAAWIAAGALSRPMRRLGDAAHRLGKSLSPATGVGIAVAPPQLDAERGTREMRETARVFNEVSRQLKTDFDTQRLMLATVSHDLRTPLTRLRMRLAQLEDHPAARGAIDDVRQMDDLIESLLALFRPAAQTTGGEERRHDAYALVQAIVDDLPAAQAEVTLAGGPADTRCPPAALRRMVENLLEVAVEGGPATLCVRVCDRGPGLSVEQLATAGTPFLRWAGEDGSRRAGLGLGLYITRALAEREGGRLELSARDGGGLCAELHLPTAS
jgi:signal transduction histidine kinase